MTRQAVRQSVEFRGIIQGCPDHQWLVIDAVRETGTVGRLNARPRWVVTSRHVRRSLNTNDAPRSKSTVTREEIYAHDTLTGWTGTSVSALNLAEQIRSRFTETVEAG